MSQTVLLPFYFHEIVMEHAFNLALGKDLSMECFSVLIRFESMGQIKC